MIYGYVRVSSEQQQKSGISLDEQQQMIAGYSSRMGLGDVKEFFIDSAVSGGIALQKRENGRRLLDVLKAGDVVIITKLDRAFRKTSDCLNTVEMLRHKKVSLHIIDLNGDVTGNGISALFLTIMAAVAEFERSIISERQKDAKRNMKNNKRYIGGRIKSGQSIETIKIDTNKEVKIIVQNKVEQNAISFIRHNMHDYSLDKFVYLIKERYELDWNRMRIYRIRKNILEYQDETIAKRWKGEKSVDWKERKKISKSEKFIAARKKRKERFLSKKI